MASATTSSSSSAFDADASSLVLSVAILLVTVAAAAAGRGVRAAAATTGWGVRTVAAAATATTVTVATLIVVSIVALWRRSTAIPILPAASGACSAADFVLRAMGLAASILAVGAIFGWLLVRDIAGVELADLSCQLLDHLFRSLVHGLNLGQLAAVEVGVFEIVDGVLGGVAQILGGFESFLITLRLDGEVLVDGCLVHTDETLKRNRVSEAKLGGIDGGGRPTRREGGVVRLLEFMVIF